MHPQPGRTRRDVPNRAPLRKVPERTLPAFQEETLSGGVVRHAALMGFERGLETEGLVNVLREFDQSLDVQLHADPSTLGRDRVGTDEFEWVLLDADGLGLSTEASIAALHSRMAKTHIVVFGRSEFAPEIDGMLRRGAAAYVPRRFAHSAIFAVLCLVQAGERFRPAPTIHSGDDPAADPSANGAQTGTLQEFGLTKAERDVLMLVAQGKTNLQIALDLKKGEGTVRVQMSAILKKLKVSNRAAAILVAMRDPTLIQAQLERIQNKPLDLDWLYPHMDFRRCRAGQVLFRKGDVGREMFVVQRGCVSLTQLGLEMHENDIFGEIAIFAPNHHRTSTAVCATDTDLFVLGEEQVRQMHFVNPAFALTVLQLITNRLLADRQRGG